MKNKKEKNYISLSISNGNKLSLDRINEKFTITFIENKKSKVIFTSLSYKDTINYFYKTSFYLTKQLNDKERFITRKVD